MKLSEVKRNLGRKVRLILPQHNVDGEYILNSIIMKLDKNNNFIYSVELLDMCNHSVTIAKLENIKVKGESKK